MSTVPPENTEDENKHLAEEHGLIPTTAYVRCTSEKQRSANAKRVAKHRQHKKEQGIVQIEVPIAIAEAIKAAGSFDAWISTFQPKLSKDGLTSLLCSGSRLSSFPLG